MDASAISLARENKHPDHRFRHPQVRSVRRHHGGQGHVHHHQGRGLKDERRPQGAREAHARRDGRAEEGVRRPAHRPRLGQPARPGDGRGLWPAHAAQPGRHGERARAAAADRQRLGQGPGHADRQGDPRRGPRPQPGAGRPDDPHPDPRAHQPSGATSSPSSRTNMPSTARVAVRNVRRDGMEALKKAEKDHKISQDEHRQKSDEVQKLTDRYVKQVDDALGDQGKRDQDRSDADSAAARLTRTDRRVPTTSPSSWMATAAGRRRAGCRAWRAIGAAPMRCGG